MHTSHTPLTAETLIPAENRISSISDQPARKLAVIYTGGTIGMVPGDRGLEPGDRIAPRLLDQLQTLPEARRQALPAFDLLTLPRLIDSANATPQDWLTLNHWLNHYRDRYLGFVILHGTDTLAYTASALSFLQPPDRPLIVSGAQYPLEAPGSDALANVEASLLTAQSLLEAPRPQSAGLIVFGGRILQGNRSVKVSTFALQGFDSPGQPVLGHCHDGLLSWQESASDAAFKTEDTEAAAALQAHASVSAQDRDAAAIPTREADEPAQVVILKLWPGIQARQISSLLAEPVKGVILESYGSGNAPDLNQPLLDAVKAATDRGVIVVNRSQCLQGPVSMNYAAGSALADAGVISGYDMTCEAAFSKLTLLLSSGLPADTVRAAFAQNYCGEYGV